MPRQRRVNRSMDPGPSTRTRGAQSRVQQSERSKLDEELDKLKFIFATRKILKENRFEVVNGILSWKLRERVQGFMTLVEEEPQLYGSVGSIKWKQGLLSYLNEPTTLTWDDVNDWLNNPDLESFFRGSLSKAFSSSSIKLVPVKRASTSEDGTLYRDKKPRLKLGIVKLTKCDARPSQQPTVNNSVNIEENEDNAEIIGAHGCIENEDLGQFSVGTPELGEHIAPILESTANDDSANIPTEVMELESVQPAVKNTKNEEVSTQEEDSPCVAQTPDVQETQLKTIEERAEVNGKSDTWLSSLEYYRKSGEMDVSELGADLGEDIQLFKGDETNNIAVSVVDDLNSPVRSPLEQIPAETTETTTQYSGTDALEVIELKAPTQNEDVVVTGSTNGDAQIPEAVDGSSKKVTYSEPDPEATYQKCVAKALEWLNTNWYQKKAEGEDRAGEQASIKCKTCIVRRPQMGVIQYLQQQVDSRILMLYDPETNMDYPRAYSEYLDLNADLNDVGKYFLNEKRACSCGGGGKSVY